jgi:hypothetical protein
MIHIIASDAKVDAELGADNKDVDIRGLLCQYIGRSEYVRDINRRESEIDNRLCGHIGGFGVNALLAKNTLNKDLMAPHPFSFEWLSVQSSISHNVIDTFRIHFCAQFSLVNSYNETNEMH